MNWRGFSLIEILLALALMSILLVGVFSLTFTLPNALASSVLREAALSRAQSLLVNAAHLSDTMAGSLTSLATSTEQRISSSLVVSAAEDESFADVQVHISWKNLFGKQQFMSIQQRLVDASSTPASCDPFVSGNWTQPVRVAHYTLNTIQLLPGTPPPQYSLGAIDAAPSRLVLGISSVSNRQAPTLLFLTETSANQLVPIAGFDNASTSRDGFSTLVSSNTTVFAGNVFGSASATTCSDTISCAQVHVFSTAGSVPQRIGSYSLATATPPYAQTVGGATAGVRALAYHDGYLFVGLEKTFRGQEFNSIDVHDVSHGIWRSGIAVGRSVTGITIRDGYAYLATDDPTRELIVVDIKNPAHPAIVSSMNLSGAFGFGAVSTVRNGIIRFGRTYSPNAKELALIDARQPSFPRVLQEVDTGTASNPQSVRGILTQDWLSFVLLSHRLEFWNTGNLFTMEPYATSYVLPTSAEGVALSCANNRIYVGYTLGSESYIDVLRGS